MKPTQTISRRGFMGAASAFAGLGLLPSWRAFKQRKAIDLTPFCDGGGSRRYSLAQPFAQDGMVYGTDARVMVRTTLAEAPELSEGANLPAASQLPWWTAEDRWEPWPKLNLIADGKDDICPHCYGNGGFGNVIDCGLCDGDGQIYQVEYDGCGVVPSVVCRACCGSGKRCDVRCGYCGGNGMTKRPSIQQIGNLFVGGHYDDRIRKLGDAEYSIVGNAGCGDYDGFVVKFRGDGFEGLLMPLFDRGPQ